MTDDTTHRRYQQLSTILIDRRRQLGMTRADVPAKSDGGMSQATVRNLEEVRQYGYRDDVIAAVDRVYRFAAGSTARFLTDGTAPVLLDVPPAPVALPTTGNVRALAEILINLRNMHGRTVFDQALGLVLSQTVDKDDFNG